MAGLISTIMILFFFFFYVNIVSSASNNTTQFDNFTIEWEDFSLLTCAVPTIINVSLFTCAPAPSYIQVDDVDCLEATSIDFDQNTCQITSTVNMYTSSILTTAVQQITAVTSITSTQTSTSITATMALSTTITLMTTSSTSQTSIINGLFQTSIASTIVTTLSSTTTTTTKTYTSTITTSTTYTSMTFSSVAYNSTITTSTTTSTTTSFNNITTTTTTHTRDMYDCESDRYIGTYCNISSDACAMSQPCRNAATCFPNNTLPYGYRCQCQLGYTGYECQYDERACLENRCWHNGTCISVNSTVQSNNGLNFKCECVEGYNGVYCELMIDLCGNITCENRGMCQTVELMWKCLCLDPSLYYGDYCQFKTQKLKIREILSKSFASVAIGAIITTCTFVVVMDILKYAFHIDPVEYERESYRKRVEERRRARRPIKRNEPLFALRFQYVS